MTPRTTEDRFQQTHNQIMDAAERVFAYKGFNGTSMNDIVKEGGFSKGAIYSHFDSKERLFLSLLERQTVIGMDQLQQTFSLGDRAVDKLLKIAKMTVSGSCDCLKNVCRMQMEFMITASRMEALEPDMQKRYKNIQKLIVDIFDEGVKRGEFRPDVNTVALTSILFAMLDGLTLHRATLGLNFDSSLVEDTLMKVVLEGILV